MAKPNYLDFITSTHELYQRYQDDFRLAVKSYYGGVEYRNGQYLKQYSIDASQSSDVINTYDIDDTGNQTAVYRSQQVASSQDANSSSGYISSFYQEKLNNVPVLPYTRLYVSEYNAILFRSPPVRTLPDTSEVNSFVSDVSGEGESINEFMSKVDTFSTVFGVVWITCIKPQGSEYPRWRMHSPLDVLNWEYTYTHSGDLELSRILIKVASEGQTEIYQHMTKDVIETIFMSNDAEEEIDIEIPEGAEYFEDDNGRGFYKLVAENELGHLQFVRPVYQSTKIYNGIGHTPIFDIAQIQRSIYGDYGEIYSSISYGAHPVTIVDEATLQQNDFNVGAEPGSVINVQNGLNGQPNYVFEFKAPPLDSIKELRELVEQKIEKMNQVAMIRSDELIKASRSGVQIEMYDSKLEAFIRKKATSLENVEAHYLWPSWFEWMGKTMPEDLSVSYNRLYSNKGLENELKEIDMLISSYDRYTATFGADVEYKVQEFPTQEQAEARAVEMGGSGFHKHTKEDGRVIFMAFPTHEEYELVMELRSGHDAEESTYKEELREKIKERLTQLIEGSSTSNGL